MSHFPSPPWTVCERPNGESCVAICAGSYEIDGIRVVDAPDMVLPIPIANGDRQGYVRAVALAQFICEGINRVAGHSDDT